MLASIVYSTIIRHTAHFVEREQTIEKTGIILSYEIDGNLWKGILEAGREKYQFYITIQSEQEKETLEKNIHLGTTLTILGTRKLPLTSGNKILFQYIK